MKTAIKFDELVLGELKSEGFKYVVLVDERLRPPLAPLRDKRNPLRFYLCFDLEEAMAKCVFYPDGVHIDLNDPYKEVTENTQLLTVRRLI